MIKKISIVLLSIILVISIIITNVYLVIINSVKSESIQETVSNIDINSFIKENEETYNKICSILEEKLGIEQEMIDNILNSDITKNVVGKVAGSYMQYMITGDESAKIKSDEVINIIEESFDDAIDLTKVQISEEKKEQIKDKVVEGIKQNSEFIDETLDKVYEVDINNIDVEEIKNTDLDGIKENVNLDNIIDLNEIDKNKINGVGGDLRNEFEQYRNSINFEW